MKTEKTASQWEATFTINGFVVRDRGTQVVSFAEDCYGCLYQMGFAQRDWARASLQFLQNFAEVFVENLLGDGDLPLTMAPKPLSLETAQDLLGAVPFVLGREHITMEWLSTQWEGLGAAFGRELQQSGLAVAEYLREKTNKTVAGRVYFHLVEYKSEETPFAFMATYSSKQDGKISHLPLKHALSEYKEDTKSLIQLLQTVTAVSDQSRFITQLMDSGELFAPLRLTQEEAYTILKEIPLYEDCGVMCRIPDWWGRKQRVGVKAVVGDKPPSQMGLEALLQFDATISLGGVTLTKEEVEELLQKSNGLAFLKGKWVEVNHEKLRDALEALERLSHMGAVPMGEAMRMELGLDAIAVGSEEIDVSVNRGQWFEDFCKQLQQPALLERTPPSAEFHATLRPYQQEGLNWLSKLGSYGFGALLADDMGLGKTVQILALLEDLRQKGGLSALLVVPASLLCNWQREAEKFAPKLRFSLLHGTKRAVDLGTTDVVLTTYGMVSKVDWLQETLWDVVILDEGQAIKNPGTKQTKLVKQLQGQRKIVLTGTPVENSVTDLWSLFDFLNPGLLGGLTQFKTFNKALKESPQGYGKLRDMTASFILRRLKTDKSIIADLPEKLEIQTPVQLSKKQVVLYQSTVKELEKTIYQAEGIDRKGAVLTAIMKLKQICNHPDQYLGQTGFAPSHSGKFQALAELCETMATKEERVLVFTQFREMTQPIHDCLAEVFGQEGLILHGGTTAKQRGDLVERFNGGDYVPFMVLSLKVGGVGLNLTAANHVIHFDRWWNPAVENQATDRAFRIGQRKDVFVYKFLTVGTLEEKINNILTDKQALSEELLAGAGEGWVTELSNAELQQLFRLEV